MLDLLILISKAKHASSPIPPPSPTPANTQTAPGASASPETSTAAPSSAAPKSPTTGTRSSAPRLAPACSPTPPPIIPPSWQTAHCNRWETLLAGDRLAVGASGWRGRTFRLVTSRACRTMLRGRLFMRTALVEGDTSSRGEWQRKCWSLSSSEFLAVYKCAIAPIQNAAQALFVSKSS